jgi:hypothetical protein
MTPAVISAIRGPKAEISKTSLRRYSGDADR